MKKLLTLLALTAILTACNTAEAPATEEQIKEAAKGTDNTYSFEDFKVHNTAEDCWLLIDRKIYDVTQYIADQNHPGGETILEGCGAENGTELFSKHSEDAKAYLENFYVGVLMQ